MKKHMKKTNKLIDLSFEINDDMLTYPSPNHVPFQSTILGQIDKDGRETRKFTMGSHCGTHVDAPKHFLKDGKSIMEFDINDLVGEALLIDLGHLKPNTIISLKNFKGELDAANKINPVRRIVFRSYWSQHWNTNQYYHGWPYFDTESIKYIINSKIKLLGLDFPSPDSQFNGTDSEEDSPNHKLLFNSDIILTEYLTNLDKLKKGMIYITVLPLKLSNFDGSPARVTAYNL